MIPGSPSRTPACFRRRGRHTPPAAGPASRGRTLAAYGRRCQSEPITQGAARELAGSHGIHLEGLGGTEDGIIGALAAVVLRAGGEDGRVVHRRGWPWPDPFTGLRTVEEVHARGVDEVRVLATGAPVHQGLVDVGKRLRPAFRGGRVVLFVESGEAAWRGLKVP